MNSFLRKIPVTPLLWGIWLVAAAQAPAQEAPLLAYDEAFRHYGKARTELLKEYSRLSWQTNAEYAQGQETFIQKNISRIADVRQALQAAAVQLQGIVLSVAPEKVKLTAGEFDRDSKS